MLRPKKEVEEEEEYEDEEQPQEAPHKAQAAKPSQTKSDSVITKEEITDMVEGHLRRAAELVQYLK